MKGTCYGAGKRKKKTNWCWEQIIQHCGARRSCASPLTASEGAPTPSYAANISVSVGS